MIDIIWSLLGDVTSWLMVAGGLAVVVASYAAPFMSPAAAFLAPLCQVARVMGFILLGLGGARLYASHEVAVATDAIAAKATAEVAAAKDREREEAITQLSALHADEIARIRRTSVVKEAIAHVPNLATAALPASGAALAELRARRAGSGAPGSAGGNDQRVPSPVHP